MKQVKTSQEVIDAFIMRREAEMGKLRTVLVNNSVYLYSYNTIVAARAGESVFVNTERYSNTTSRQVKLLTDELRRQGIGYIEVPAEALNGSKRNGS